MYANQVGIEEARTKLEKLMMELDPSKTESERRMYIAGVIDTYRDLNHVSTEDGKTLYAEFFG